MPFDPFTFDISHTDFKIIFSNHGHQILVQDATDCVHMGLDTIEKEIYSHWTNPDIPIPGNLAFGARLVELKLNYSLDMLRTYCLMLLVGILEWGQSYGFIEVDMEFLIQKVGLRRRLGTGSLRLSGATS